MIAAAINASMPIMEQDLDIKERIRLLHTAVRTSKAGKSEAALNAVLQEILGILNLNTNLEVVSERASL